MASRCNSEDSGCILGTFLLQQIRQALAQLPREVVQSLSLEVLKNRVAVALRDVVSGHSGDGLLVGLDELCGLFQP